MPAVVRDGTGETEDVRREASVRGAEPVGDKAAVVAPEKVVLPVPVEVTDADDVPAVVRDPGPGVGLVGHEAAVRLAQPFGDIAAAVAPEDVVPPVAIEIAGADDMPAVVGNAGSGISLVGYEAAACCPEPLRQ